jgi:hypothetical protein
MSGLFANPRRAMPRVIWAGIAANMLFVIPLLFFPKPFFALLGLELTDTILARACAMLLFIISVFYIPAAWDLDRYRANAWFHCFPSRFCGATYFSVPSWSSIIPSATYRSPSSMRFFWSWS